MPALLVRLGVGLVGVLLTVWTGLPGSTFPASLRRSPGAGAVSWHSGKCCPLSTALWKQAALVGIYLQSVTSGLLPPARGHVGMFVLPGAAQSCLQASAPVMGCSLPQDFIQNIVYLMMRGFA